MEETSEFNNELQKKDQRALSFFWIGFIIYTLADTITKTRSVNSSLYTVLQLLGMIMFVIAAMFLVKPNNIDNKYLKLMFFFYFVWQVGVVFRGFELNYKFLNTMLFSSMFGIFQYLVPLVILFKLNILALKKLFNVILILGFFYIVFDILFLKELTYSGRNILSRNIIEYFSLYLSIPSGFLLITYIYHSRTRRLFAFSVIIITFLFAVIRARRGLMFLSLFPLIVSFFIYAFSSRYKFLRILFSLFLGIFIIYYSSVIYKENKYGTFRYITVKINKDTRADVERYFYHDMKPVDWVIGRGINGKYYCPGISWNSLYRDVIELGYLNIILKGGIISLGLFLLIAIPGMIKGFFNSRNLLSKAAAAWILLFLLSLYPTGLNTFSLNYILVWLSIAICYNSDIGSKTDDAIMAEFKNQGKK